MYLVSRKKASSVNDRHIQVLTLCPVDYDVIEIDLVTLVSVAGCHCLAHTSTLQIQPALTIE